MFLNRNFTVRGEKKRMIGGNELSLPEGSCYRAVGALAKSGEFMDITYQDF